MDRLAHHDSHRPGSDLTDRRSCSQWRSRRFGSLLLGGLGLAGLSFVAGCDSEPARPIRAQDATVLLVVLDALHAENLSHLGYERATTPNLDRLAADGVSFSQAFSPAPYTRAGIPSILTGRLPDMHGMVRGERVLDPSEVTLAELLGETGRPTRGAVANLNGSELYGLDQGFDEFHNHLLALDGRSADLVVRGATYHQPKAEEYLPRMKGWLDEDAGRPAFYYLHYLEPHSPYHPPTEYRERWLDPAYDGPFVAGNTTELVASVKGELVASEDDIEAVRALYDATLAYADAQFGLVLDELERRGLYDDMLIIVTSDHGEALWQHGRWGHNDQLYDEMLHVPLIVKMPTGQEPQRRIESALVSTIDIVPSLIGWCGLEPPRVGLDGLSLDDLMFDTGREFNLDRELILRTNEDEPDLGLRTVRDKTIVNRFPGGVIQSLEHYDLRRDPDERRNLVDDQADLVTARARMLKDYRQRRGEVLAGRPEVKLTQAQMDVLEALGYTTSGGVPPAVPDAHQTDAAETGAAGTGAVGTGATPDQDAALDPPSDGSSR